MGDRLSQFPILSQSTTQTPLKTLVRRDLSFSETMRVVLSWSSEEGSSCPSSEETLRAYKVGKRSFTSMHCCRERSRPRFPTAWNCTSPSSSYYLRLPSLPLIADLRSQFPRHHSQLAR
jgi:hypothetical protein